MVAETEPGIVMGTVGYMSPEQVRGEPVDHRSDIFSFGAVLYEMLSGHRAFGGRSAADTLSAILKEDPPELTQTNREIPPSLDRVVRHCLEKSPQARIQAARDVAFALEEVSGASAAAPPHVAVPAHPRSTLRLAIGALVLALLAVLAINGGRIRERLSGAAAAGRLQSIAVLPLQNFSHDAEQEYFADGMTEELITNLAQIGSLRVISRTSVMGYKGTKKRVPEIGGELNVDTVLEGSVQRSGQRVRITAQLVRVSTDEHLWAKELRARPAGRPGAAGGSGSRHYVRDPCAPPAAGESPPGAGSRGEPGSPRSPPEGHYRKGPEEVHGVLSRGHPARTRRTPLPTLDWRASTSSSACGAGCRRRRLSAKKGMRRRRRSGWMRRWPAGTAGWRSSRCTTTGIGRAQSENTSAPSNSIPAKPTPTTLTPTS